MEFFGLQAFNIMADWTKDGFPTVAERPNPVGWNSQMSASKRSFAPGSPLRPGLSSHNGQMQARDERHSR
jgi:hypothetical protein